MTEIDYEKVKDEAEELCKAIKTAVLLKENSDLVIFTALQAFIMTLLTNSKNEDAACLLAEILLESLQEFISEKKKGYIND